jgi:WW domain
MERSPEKPPSPNSPHQSDTAAPPDQADQLEESPGLSSDDREGSIPNNENSSPNKDAPITPDKEAPPLPAEPPPPLPSEPPTGVDDGWEPLWDEAAQAFYFYNRFTNKTQWENPRVPEANSQDDPAGVGNHDRPQAAASRLKLTGYNPAIHGDYDPNADYAKPQATEEAIQMTGAPGTEPGDAYAATGAFNRFTGKWQNAEFTTERFSDEQKSKRQMNAFFDVDAAANNHNGRSLRAERASKKLSKRELQAFKEKRREKKEEKRRAWLRD